MTNIITVNTFVGGLMLVLSIVLLVIGINKARHGGKLIGGSNAGVYILVGFALLAMGSLTFLFGTFRPGP